MWILFSSLENLQINAVWMKDKFNVQILLEPLCVSSQGGIQICIFALDKNTGICIKVKRRSYEYGNAEANASGCVSHSVCHSGARPMGPEHLPQTFSLNAMLPISKSPTVFSNRLLCFRIMHFSRLPRSPIFFGKKKKNSCQNLRRLHILSKIFKF